MSLTLRPFNLEDAEACGQICYEAFKQIDEAHGFPSSFKSAEDAGALLTARAQSGFYAVVAERDGRIAGSNFMDVRSRIGGIGPVTVAVDNQDGAIGRALMGDVMGYAAMSGLAGVRLTQAAYHSRSLSLYTKLGFVVREPLAALSGDVNLAVEAGFSVRALTEADIEVCGALCRRVHGHERSAELLAAVQRTSARGVERQGRLTGYTTRIGGGHAVAESNADLQALISAEGRVVDNLLIPTRNAELFRWCLEAGLRVVKPMTLMSHGLYNRPDGAFIPSYLY
jgi:predicted N-acetyltransferase YhbS